MKEVKIALDSDKREGVYSNLMNISHSKEEFVLDFLAKYEEGCHLGARIVVNPHHLKRMITALEENFKKYEEDHGSVTPAEAPKTPMGFSVG